MRAIFFCLNPLLFFFSVHVFSQNYTTNAVHIHDLSQSYFVASQPFIDRDGFVWYAVNEQGTFFKYDGINIVKFTMKDSDEKRFSITAICINAWTQDRKGNVWAINPDGAYVINPNTFNVKHIKWQSKHEIRSNQDVSALQDKKNNIWISTGENYVIKIDKNYNQKIFQSPELPRIAAHKKQHGAATGAENLPLKVIKELDQGKILVKSRWNLYLIDDKGMQFILNFKEDGSNLHFTQDGEIFKPHTSGTVLFNGKKYNYSYLKNLNIQMFNCPYDNFSYKNSKFFTVQADKVFIEKFNKEKIEFTVTDTFELHFDRKIINNSLTLDSNNIIWFSNNYNIVMLKPTDARFKKYLQIKNSPISAKGIVSDDRGNLYVCSSTGLFKLDAKGQLLLKIYDPSNSGNIYNSMLIDQNGILWAAGEGAFITSIDLRTNVIATRKYGKRFDFNCTFLKAKSKDSFWVGSDKGLFILDKKSGKLFRCKLGNINSDRLTVYDILQSGNGNLWVATNNGLYFKGKGKKWIDYKAKNSFFSNRKVYVLHEDANKNIWLGTHNSGAVCLNLKTQKIDVYDESAGLSNNAVYGILEADGQFWFSTFFGISALHKKNMKFNNFHLQDGLPDNECILRSFYKKNDSSFYFGGLNGIVELNPKEFNFKKRDAKIFISKTEYFSIERKENVTDYLNENRSITLPYNKNYFSVEFTTNDMYNNRRSTYFYRINGLTDGWVGRDGIGIVKLSNLPPGKFVIELKVKDFYGSEITDHIKINVLVEQIFYKTPFFLGFIFLLLIAFVIYIFRRKIRKQKKIFEREKEIIILKSNALKAQMNPHFVFNILNNMQSIMILKGEEEANRYFGAFSRLLRLTLDISKQESVSLKDELDYINQYLILSSLQLNEELKFSIFTDENVNKEDIFIPGMLIQPFVENAIIHGLSPKEGEKAIKITCFIENDFCVVKVEDNGVGREAASKLTQKREFVYKSWSTAIVKERIELINSSSNSQKIILQIEDLKTEDQSLGTAVTIKFKIK
ncbi:histidine kinase [Flavobacterium sp. GSB-24]|nr:histidine kinase [Flavobacterium sp. GSB-24]